MRAVACLCVPLVLAFAASGSSSCTGFVGAGDEAGVAPGAASGAGARAAGASAGGAGSVSGPLAPAGMTGALPAPKSCAPAARLGPTPLRRLSRLEYNNAVRDLFGVTSRPADAFPVDESVAGFESNSVAPPTRLHVERFIEAAETIAAQADLTKVVPCALAQGDEACVRQFVERTGRRVFRRPVRPDEADRLLAVFRSKRSRGGDFAAGVRLVLATMLYAPPFLYKLEGAMPASSNAQLEPLGPFELGARLSFFLWSSTPDDRLLDLAAAGTLARPEVLEVEARRLAADPRAADAIQSFHSQWLELNRWESVSKDERLFPDFKLAALRAAILQEPARFVTSLMREGDRSVATLLTASHSFVEAGLARHYGVPAPASGWARADMPAGQRSGVLTMAAPLTVHAFPDQESPIHRGLFVRQNLLCGTVPDPPIGVDIQPPKVNPMLSSKERFEQHRKDPACRTCHQLMDPIGFAFGNYDAIGRWQVMDGRVPVDAVGELAGTEAIDGPVNGALDLGKKLAGAREVHRCLATQWARFALGRGELPEEACLLEPVVQRFAAAKLDLRELLIALVMSDLFTKRPAL